MSNKYILTLPAQSGSWLVESGTYSTRKGETSFNVASSMSYASGVTAVVLDVEADEYFIVTFTPSASEASLGTKPSATGPFHPTSNLTLDEAAQLANQIPSAAVAPSDDLFSTYISNPASATNAALTNFVADKIQAPTVIGPTLPANLPARYAWWQTGLGDDGTGMTLWIEDGTP